MERAKHLWEKWDAEIRRGRSPQDVLEDVSDESLIEMLAAGNPEVRRFELNVIMTEAENRMIRRRRDVKTATEEAGRAIEDAQDAVAHAVARATDAEVQHAAEALAAQEEAARATRDIGGASERLGRLKREAAARARHADEE